MKVMGYKVQVDHLDRISLISLYDIAVNTGHEPIPVEEFIYSYECQRLISGREWMLSDVYAEKLLALKYCESIDIEFMFDVYYDLF